MQDTQVIFRISLIFTSAMLVENHFNIELNNRSSKRNNALTTLGIQSQEREFSRLCSFGHWIMT